MKNKLMIFDMDGTLFRTEEANYLAYKKALSEFSVILTREYFLQNCFGKSYKQFLPELLSQGTVNTIQAVHNYKIELYPTFLDTVYENKRLFSLIENVKDQYFISLVTTASSKNCYMILEHFKRVEYFDLVLTQKDVKQVKPNPEGYLKAITHFGVLAENTLIFEDSSDGIEAAKQSGAGVLGVVNF